jgi:hypothetical protein
MCEGMPRTHSSSRQAGKRLQGASERSPLALGVRDENTTCPVGSRDRCDSLRGWLRSRHGAHGCNICTHCAPPMAAARLHRACSDPCTHTHSHTVRLADDQLGRDRRLLGYRPDADSGTDATPAARRRHLLVYRERAQWTRHHIRTRRQQSWCFPASIQEDSAP